MTFLFICFVGLGVVWVFGTIAELFDKPAPTDPTKDDDYGLNRY